MILKELWDLQVVENVKNFCFGILSSYIKVVSFCQLIADALHISDIYVYFRPENKLKNFLYNML
jgi:hypothetical protein